MKTLADLKRDAASGKMSLELIERYGQTGEEIKSTMRGIRPVIGCNSVSISILNHDGNISELRYGCAKLVEYDGEAETLTLFAAGHRELTDEEQALLDEWRAVEKQYLKDNPLGDSYWKHKHFFATSACPWLSGYETIRGKCLDYVEGRNMIRDNSIKGEAVLKYKVHMKRGDACA